MKDRLGEHAVFVGLLGVVMLAMSNAVSASVITASPFLPPDTGVYLNVTGSIEFRRAGDPTNDPILTIFEPQFSPSLTPGVGITRSSDGLNETQTYESVFQGLTVTGDLTLRGPITTVAFGKASDTGTWNTEMVSMRLDGDLLLGGTSVIRLDESRRSLGRTTVTYLADGNYQVDSFFDVFTELSIDGGKSFTPSSGFTRMQLVPEPSTTTSLFLMAICGAGLRWRRKRRAA